MRIDYRGGELRMAQGLLHQADIFGGAVELGGIGVPEHMRMHVFADPGFAPASSGRRLPLIPVETCHRFQLKVATDSD
jgi:hypothetical protein